MRRPPKAAPTKLPIATKSGASCSRPSNIMCCATRACGGRERGSHFRHAPHRGVVPSLRRPSWSRVHRRAETDRAALLHERRCVEIHGGTGGVELVERSSWPDLFRPSTSCFTTSKTLMPRAVARATLYELENL